MKNKIIVFLALASILLFPAIANAAIFYNWTNIATQAAGTTWKPGPGSGYVYNAFGKDYMTFSWTGCGTATATVYSYLANGVTTIDSTALTSGTAVRLRSPYFNIALTATTTISAGQGGIYITGP